MMLFPVPGALEIPAAIAMAATNSCPYDGFMLWDVCGVRQHYETVCTESSRGLMDLAIYRNLAIGNGILTVEC